MRFTMQSKFTKMMLEILERLEFLMIERSGIEYLSDSVRLHH
jgi:hypothetical protein